MLGCLGSRYRSKSLKGTKAQQRTSSPPALTQIQTLYIWDDLRFALDGQHTDVIRASIHSLNTPPKFDIIVVYVGLAGQSFLVFHGPDAHYVGYLSQVEQRVQQGARGLAIFISNSDDQERRMGHPDFESSQKMVYPLLRSFQFCHLTISDTVELALGRNPPRSLRDCFDQANGLPLLSALTSVTTAALSGFGAVTGGPHKKIKHDLIQDFHISQGVLYLLSDLLRTNSEPSVQARFQQLCKKLPQRWSVVVVVVLTAVEPLSVFEAGAYGSTSTPHYPRAALDAVKAHLKINPERDGALFLVPMTKYHQELLKGSYISPTEDTPASGPEDQDTSTNPSEETAQSNPAASTSDITDLHQDRELKEGSERRDLHLSACPFVHESVCKRLRENEEVFRKFEIRHLDPSLLRSELASWTSCVLL